MRYTDLCGNRVSALGFGAMRLPRLADGSIARRTAFAMVRHAIAGGVNYFDTAYPYHRGESEGFLREALSEYPRESYYLADKMPVWLCKTRGDAERIFAEQLGRCGVDYFDYYLVHSLDEESFPTMESCDIYSFIAGQKAAGTIKHIGFSFHGDKELMAKLLDKYEWDFVQIELNYLDWTQQEAGELYRMITEKGLPVVVMEPLRGGFLANLPSAAARPLKLTDPDISLSEWAFRWLFQLPGVSVTLSGMSTLEQVKDNLRIFGAPPLPGAFLPAVDDAVRVLCSMERVPCTACGYCMPCPAGVDIPGMLKIYNKFLENHYTSEFRIAYNNAPSTARAENCTSCGACAKVCPQGIAAHRHMKDMAAYVRNFH